MLFVCVTSLYCSFCSDACTHTHNLTHMYTSVKVLTDICAHTDSYLSLSICRSFSRSRTLAHCLPVYVCISPLRCDDNNCNNKNDNNNNYILIQNAHLPHFNFTRLHAQVFCICQHTSEREEERKKEWERERRTASLLERPLSVDGLSRNGCSLVRTFVRSLLQSLLMFNSLAHSAQFVFDREP